MYSTIYADPAWITKAGRPLSGYKVVNGKQIWFSGHSKSRELSYSSMSVKDICKLPVQNLTNADAHLYIWVTNQYLPFVFQVLEAWGFKYSTTLVWVKNAMGGGLGGAFRITTEFLIFARKGKLKTKENTIGTWFNVKRTYKNGFPRHSVKPDFFRELIEKTSPGPYLEMFARDKAQGWDVWGNEIENSIQLIIGER